MVAHVRLGQSTNLKSNPFLKTTHTLASVHHFVIKWLPNSSSPSGISGTRRGFRKVLLKILCLHYHAYSRPFLCSTTLASYLPHRHNPHKKVGSCTMQVSTRKYGGKPSKWPLPYHDSVATTIWCYMICIKGFHRHGQWAACLAQRSLLGPQSLLVQLLRLQRNLSSQNNNEKNKAIIKQKNQSAQKNVNLFLLNTRVKTKKGKIPSFGFGVAE